MARKSRKQIAVEEPVIEPVSSEVFSTAIYARLSVENSGKSEKVDVIANQIEICKSYIAERPYLNLIDTYVDNGRTGTVFDRPEFNRLMNDIRTGRIKCLVVRDLSRFGRDYIEAGTYLERVFPQIGLRFIAIKENYDNFDADGSGESLIIPLQNMINTLYSKDISRKVSTALKAQMESGEFKKRNLPYGYRWDEEHSNMVFDEETAPIVRKIFQWKIEGLSLPAIADRLDAMNAPNPEFQKYQVGVRTGNATAKKIWNKSSLTTILDNPHYVGDTVLGRTLNAIYKGVKNQHIDREEWIVFPNTHEAIISREDFQKVQELRDAAARTRIEKMERTEKIRATLINLFEDKIICADCGDTVLGRTLNAIYKGVKNQHIDREEWIVFPNTHEAIISREDFQKVQELRDAAARTRIEKMERTEKIRATLINLFEDKIICADCGRKLYFHRKRVDKRKDGAWYAFYECSSSVKRGNLCTPHYTRQDKLEADVLAAIQLQVKAALNYDKLLAKLRNSEGERSIRDQQNALITSLNLKLSGISKKRTRLYEDFTEGILDEEEYVFAKKAYDEQYANLSRRLDEAVQRKVKFAEAMSEDNKWLTLMKSVSGATMLSQELVDESVELVKVHEDGSIELVMKYGDIYALTVQSIKEVQEAM